MIGNDRLELDDYLTVIKGLPLAEADKSFLAELRWTQEEFGEITSLEQYDAFGRAQATIEADAEQQGIPAGSLADASPEVKQRYVDWTRTPAGIMWTVLGGARLGWEEEHG